MNCFFYDEMKHPKSKLVVMLDLQGTLNGLSDDKAKKFMEQLDFLCNKFRGSKVLLTLSSHVFDVSSMIQYLDIFHRNLKPNIEIAVSSFLGGTYDYQKKEITYQYFGYNFNKLDTFEQNFLDDDVVWFAIIDDQINFDCIRDFQKKRFMMFCRPSRLEGDLKEDNLLCCSSVYYGFDGVLDAMNKYIFNIQNLSVDISLENQVGLILSFKNFEIQKLLFNRAYDVLCFYIIHGMFDQNALEDVRFFLLNYDFSQLNDDEMRNILPLFQYFSLSLFPKCKKRKK